MAAIKNFIVAWLSFTAAVEKLYGQNHAAAHTYSGYLFTYFEGSSDIFKQELRFAVSQNAVNWYALNGKQPIIAWQHKKNRHGLGGPCYS